MSRHTAADAAAVVVAAGGGGDDDDGDADNDGNAAWSDRSSSSKVGVRR